MIRSLSAFIALLFANCVSSFAPFPLVHLTHQRNGVCIFQSDKRPPPVLRTTGNDDDVSDPNQSSTEESSSSSDNVGEAPEKMKPTSRIGGRSKKSRQAKEVPIKADFWRSKDITSILSKFRAPALVVLVLLLLKGFFSGSESSPTYYYSYSSTVYETRTYVSDGEVKTSRSESRSFKSNIPGMEETDPFRINFRNE